MDEPAEPVVPDLVTVLGDALTVGPVYAWGFDVRLPAGRGVPPVTADTPPTNGHPAEPSASFAAVLRLLPLLTPTERGELRHRLILPRSHAELTGQVGKEAVQTGK